MVARGNGGVPLSSLVYTWGSEAFNYAGGGWPGFCKLSGEGAF